jgi:hypothetical protein
MAAFLTWRSKHANMLSPVTGLITLPPVNGSPAVPQSSGQTGQS